MKIDWKENVDSLKVRTKWFYGIGQEAIAVGAAYALQQDEWMMPMHRNLGIFTTQHAT